MDRNIKIIFIFRQICTEKLFHMAETYCDNNIIFAVTNLI